MLSTILFNIYINDLAEQLRGASRSSDTLNEIRYVNEVKINILLFVDNLPIFSLSKENLKE